MHRPRAHASLGFSLIDLKALLLVLFVLLALLAPALSKSQRNARALKDAVHLKQIHQACMIFGQEWQMKLPLPGLIDRMADPFVGQVPGRGPEDLAKNTSANLYSSMIMQNYFNPDLVVGPTEVNPVVATKDDYDWNLYNPIDDVYWDASFRTTIDATSGEGVSNASYAHLALCGERKTDKWVATPNGSVPLFATRGVEGGLGQGNVEYDLSPTLHLHGLPTQWVGNVCFGDNHMEQLNTFFPTQTTFIPPGGKDLQADNIFKDDGGSDAWLVINEVTSADGQRVEALYDALFEAGR